MSHPDDWPMPSKGRRYRKFDELRLPPTPEQRARAKIRLRQQRVAEAEAELERILNRPKDTHPDFTVLRFTKPGRFTGSDTRELTYAAIKAGENEGRPRWFLSGIEQYGKTWDALLDFIGHANLSTIEVASFIDDITPEVQELLDAWVGWFRDRHDRDPYGPGQKNTARHWQSSRINWTYALGTPGRNMPEAVVAARAADIIVARCDAAGL